MVSQFHIFLTLVFCFCDFFSHPIRRKPAHDWQHPRGKQVSARTWPSVDPEREFAAGNLDPLRVRLRPARACRHGFRHSLFHYLALHLTSHHLFFTLLYFTSVLSASKVTLTGEMGGFGSSGNWKVAPKFARGLRVVAFFFSLFFGMLFFYLFSGF